MKVTQILLVTLFYIVAIHGNNDEINHGASTSKQADQRELMDECARAEIQNYVRRLVRLMTAQDINGLPNVLDMWNHRFLEMEAFVNEIQHILMITENSHNYPGELSAAQRNARLEYFSTILNQAIADLLAHASVYHYHSILTYAFNLEWNMNVVKEYVTCEEDDCLCSNNRHEREIHSIPLTLPATKALATDLTIIQSAHIGDVFTETTLYPIIPLELISRFFEAWLSPDDPSTVDPRWCSFNNCLHTLVGRIKRAMQKIVLVNMKRSKAYKNPSVSAANDNPLLVSREEDILTAQSLRNVRSWFSGNLFIGPIYRGPSNPTFGRSGDQLLDAFDEDSEPIIGRQHYREARFIFEKLRSFLRNVNLMSPIDRIMHGFHIFATMSIMLNKYEVTQLRVENWMPSTITLDDARRIVNHLDFILSPDEVYWVIKKNPRRDPRSVEYSPFDGVEKSAKNNHTITKQRWDKFITDTMKVWYDTDNKKNQLLKWSCNFSRMYDTYFFQSPMLNAHKCCPDCGGFHNYLYALISSSKEWRVCNNEAQTSVASGWCSAWRRIIVNLDTIVHEDLSDTHVFEPIKDRLGSQKWKTYFQDMEIMVDWLSSKVNMTRYETVKYVHPNELPKYLPKLHDHSHSAINVGLCYVTTLIPTLLTWKNDCRKKFG